MIVVQRLASDALTAVLAGRNLDQVLRKTWSQHAKLTAAERGAIQDISFGAVRWYGEFSAVLQQLVAKPISDVAVSSLLIVALFQLKHTRAKDHAVVDHAVQTIQAMGKTPLKGFVNGVLRSYLRQREMLESTLATVPEAVYSYPAWWITKLRIQYPENWQAILTWGNLHPPMTLRVNSRKTSLEDYRLQLAKAGIDAREMDHEAITLANPISTDVLPGFREGLVSVQDYSAQQAARLLDVAPDHRVLDACAAPGGKTAHLIELGASDVTAIDIDQDRLDTAANNLARLEMKAKLVAGDAGKLPTWWDDIPFDRILCDAPCTASGVVKRHPDIKWLRREADIATFAQQQARLLAVLWQTLKSGGRLLYVTCSVFREENQDQIADFCRRHSDAVQLPLLLHDQQQGQLLPNARGDGFYFALLEKN